MESKKILKELISFNTINDEENKKIIDFIEKHLQNQGFVTEYKSKCLIMSNKKECNIGFLGHTDTVSTSNEWSIDPFKLTELNGNLYGLGTCDMKGSIAAMLTAISKIDFSKYQKGIKLFFTYDEEINFSGINELMEKRIKFPNWMIIGEPTNNEIFNASKGLLELKIVFKGTESHSSKPEEGINAIEKCLDFIKEIKKFYKNLKKQKLDSQSITMNIGLINGGRSINVVPDNCEVYLDFRTIKSNQNKTIINTIKKLAKNNDIYFEIINNIEPFISKSNKITMSSYITEASFIESENKYILGLGPNTAHKKDEFISIESLNKLEKQYIELIEKYCK